MRSLIKLAKWLMLTSGILITLLGISMLFTPFQNLLALVTFIGVSMLISGIAEVIAFFGEEKGNRTGWILASGIITTAIGIWISFGHGSEFLLSIMPYVFGIWVIISSIMHMVGSRTLKLSGHSYWVWHMLFGILGIAFGAFALFSPMFSSAIIAYTIALILISYGAHNIAVYFRIRKFGNHVRKRLDL
ncbi:MAG: hypothetical protein GX025_06965 [Clostridiales bacterium]|nr:hypothetical protein [Clostridiales bacterium]